MGTMLVAAGGGGDAITAAALARPLKLTPPLVIMTYSWDRLLIDPLPGPRTIDDFTGLDHLAPNVSEVLATTQPKPPAGSSLPRLAAELPVRLILLDPSNGAKGMAQQIASTAQLFGADRLVLVDVGGDALTDGTESGLRSPLADQLAIAACIRSGAPSRLLVAAPGIDGELDSDLLRGKLNDLRAQRLPNLTADDLDPIRHVFEWHPSEASGLLAAAASGSRGTVEVRDAGDLITLSDETPSLYLVDLEQLPRTSPSRALTVTGSLEDAESILIDITGVSELRYEADKAAARRERREHAVTLDDLDTIDQHADHAASLGVDYISARRLAELVGVTTLDSYAALNELVATHRPQQHATSLYAVRPLPATQLRHAALTN